MVPEQSSSGMSDGGHREQQGPAAGSPMLFPSFHSKTTGHTGSDSCDTTSKALQAWGAHPSQEGAHIPPRSCLEGVN